MVMKTYTIVKFIESSNRFNMYVTSFMSVCYWLFNHFTGKKTIFSQSVDLESFQFWFLIFLGRRKRVVLSHVLALHSNKSLAKWLHVFLLTWERTTYSQWIHNTFCSSMMSKNGASLNPKYLQLGPVLWN